MRAPALVALVAIACSGKEAPAAPEPPPSAPSAEVGGEACADPVPAVVATVNGTPVTRAELEAEGAGSLLEARLKLHQARKAAVEGLIIDRLVDAEIEARGISEEQLLAEEVEAKIKPVSDTEIEAFYTANQAQMQAPLEVMKPQIAGYLEQQQAGELTRAFLQSLEDKYEVNRHLEPLRLTVDPEDSPSIGPADAPITIIEFSDFQCPYCTMAAETVREVRAKYGDKVRVVYRHFPLPMHRQAGKASEASECAHDQGKFWEYHDMLFADQRPWSQSDLLGYAKELKLDMAAFEPCLMGGAKAGVVEDDLADGRVVGMSGTPGFYINGIVLSGAQPLSAFDEVISSELRRLGLE